MIKFIALGFIFGTLLTTLWWLIFCGDILFHKNDFGRFFDNFPDGTCEVLHNKGGSYGYRYYSTKIRPLETLESRWSSREIELLK